MAIFALALAGVAVWIARDTRDRIDDLTAENAALKARVKAFKPTLVVQGRGGDPFTAPRAPANGELANITIACPDGYVVVGGGFNGLDGVTIAGSLPQGGFGGSRAHGDGWLVNAANENGGRGRVAPAALCARGEGGLRVRSTVDASAKGRKESP